MVDRERVLAKADELHGYVRELRAIAPATIEDYRRPAIRRACERLIQIGVECVIDVCQLFVSGLRLGLPSGEDDLLDRLDSAGIFSHERIAVLRRMRGCRNILIEYGNVSDEIVFGTLRTCLGDFDAFARGAVDALARSHP